MANKYHASLTGDDLHEPKGVAEASAGTVYRANGTGSGAWVQPNSYGVLVYSSSKTFNGSITPVVLSGYDESITLGITPSTGTGTLTVSRAGAYRVTLRGVFVDLADDDLSVMVLVNGSEEYIWEGSVSTFKGLEWIIVLDTGDAVSIAYQTGTVDAEAEIKQAQFAVEFIGDAA